MYRAGKRVTREAALKPCIVQNGQFLWQYPPLVGSGGKSDWSEEAASSGHPDAQVIVVLIVFPDRSDRLSSAQRGCHCQTHHHPLPKWCYLYTSTQGFPLVKAYFLTFFKECFCDTTTLQNDPLNAKCDVPLCQSVLCVALLSRRGISTVSRASVGF